MEVIAEQVESVIVLSLVARKSVKIKGKRVCEDRDGLSEYLRFVEALTEGTKGSIREEEIEFTPGALVGGSVEFTCRYNSIPEILVSILPICGLCKYPIKLLVKGTTNSSRREGLSIDLIKSVHSRVLSQFGVNVEIRVNRRAIFPSLDGEVLFLSERVSELSPVQIDRREMLSQIVSVNYSARIPSDILNRITNLHRDLLKPVTPSVKIYNEIGNRSNSGSTPGYGALLLAMGRSSIYYAEYTVDQGQSLLEAAPEKRSKLLVKEFLKTVRRSGGYDKKIQPFLFMLLALTSPDASAVLLGKINGKGREVLSHLEKMLKYTYTIEPYRRSEQDVNSGLSPDLLVIKSFGVGYKNIYKPAH